MASLHSDRSEHFPKIPKQRLVEAKPGTQLTYFEDSGVDVRELWRDHGNERQLYRNSPPMIIGHRKSGSQNSSRTSSPVPRRNEVFITSPWVIITVLTTDQNKLSVTNDHSSHLDHNWLFYFHLNSNIIFLVRICELAFMKLEDREKCRMEFL